MLCEISFKI